MKINPKESVFAQNEEPVEGIRLEKEQGFDDSDDWGSTLAVLVVRVVGLDMKSSLQRSCPQFCYRWGEDHDFVPPFKRETVWGNVANEDMKNSIC